MIGSMSISINTIITMITPNKYKVQYNNSLFYLYGWLNFKSPIQHIRSDTYVYTHILVQERYCDHTRELLN